MRQLGEFQKAADHFHLGKLKEAQSFGSRWPHSSNVNLQQSRRAALRLPLLQCCFATLFAALIGLRQMEVMWIGIARRSRHWAMRYTMAVLEMWWQV